MIKLVVILQIIIVIILARSLWGLPDTLVQLEPQCPVPSSFSEADRAQIIDTMSAVLRQEMSYYTQLPAPEKATQATPIPQQKNTPSSAANAKAYTDALVVVDIAIASGRWTKQHNNDLRPLVSLLTPEQRLEIINKIGQATVNRQVNMREFAVGL